MFRLSFFKLGNKPVLFIIILLFTSLSLKAQNIVPNGSFEDYTQCPTALESIGDDQLERCVDWHKANLATSDYFNACQTNITTGVSIPQTWSGYQFPFEGNAYTGIIIYEGDNSNAIYLSEYIQCKLTKPLKACQYYQVRFWTNLSDYSTRGTNTLGARLDKEAIKKENPFDFYGFELPPHIGVSDFLVDTANWVLISGVYLAEGGEQYLTIGRFLDTNLYTNFNFPYIKVNCNICYPDSSYHFAQYYIDSVSVVELAIKQVEIEIPNVLTVNGDGLNDSWFPISNCSNEWTCFIYNRWGNLIFEFNQSNQGWNGEDNKGKELIEGVYYYILFEGKNKKTGFIQLIR